VLNPFEGNELEQVEALIPQMIDAVDQWLYNLMLRLGIVGLPMSASQRCSTR